MTYKGKVDWWIGLAILVAIGAPVVPAIQKHNYWMLAAPVATILFLLVGAWPQKYETAGDALYIRAGLTKRVIPWSGITRVSASSDSGSSLVLSLDRLLVQHVGGEILIAPDDQAGFFDDIASHCPQLSRRGMDLVIALN